MKSKIKIKTIVYIIIFQNIIFLCFYKIKNPLIFSCKNQNNQMNLVIPTIAKDYYKFSRNSKYFIKYLYCIRNIVLIGDSDTETIIKNNNSSRIPFQFIHQDKLINSSIVRKLISNRSKDAIDRSGWYIQQFLKMEYSKICQDKYYLVWDSDTIPVKKISMFDENDKPYFDVMEKYGEGYFLTLKKIFPELGKIYKYSFVSEHMLINTEIMRKLINSIESKTNLIGNLWYEKVINCINITYLNFTGFSEFETYGTFTYIYYNNSYVIRNWNSLRFGNRYFDPNLLNNRDIRKVSRKYDAISFEKWDI